MHVPLSLQPNSWMPRLPLLWSCMPGASLARPRCCPASSSPPPTVIWRLPSSLLLRWRPDPSPGCEVQEEVLLGLAREARKAPAGIQLHSNGSLVIQEFGWKDRGTYTCYVDNRSGFRRDGAGYLLTSLGSATVRWRWSWSWNSSTGTCSTTGQSCLEWSRQCASYCSHWQASC